LIAWAGASAVFIHASYAADELGELFTPEHVAKLRSVGSAVISPDGESIAYTLSIPRKPFKDENGGAWAELHVADREGRSRPFITGEVNVDDVQWMPDGRGISFLLKRGNDKNKSLYVIAVDGGEARRVLTHEADIRSYSWSHDCLRVAFIANEKEPEEAKKQKDKGLNAEIFEEDYRQQFVWIASPDPDAEKIEPRKIDLPGTASDLHWSPVDNRLLLALAPTPLIDDNYMRRRVRIVDADSGETLVQYENPGKLGPIDWSPDGKHIAILSAADYNDPSEGQLMVAPSTGGDLVELIPNYEGHVNSFAWQDNDTIMYLGDEGVFTVFAEIGRDGKNRKAHVPGGRLVLHGLTLSKDGQSAAMRLESPTHPNELAIMSHGDQAPHKLTNSNPWLADLRLAPQEVVRFKARDGLDLEGILIRPLDEVVGQRYPLILSVHGGPEAHEQQGWQTAYARPGQVAAARGFAVFHPNYRGSTGRGVNFSKLGQADYAGKEFDDLVDAVDHLIETGLVDRDHVGVTGGSYGGYATAWCCTYYSDRFAAGCMFVGIGDAISKGGTTDIPEEMFAVHSRTRLWDNWQFYLERSPIYHIKKAKTPLLILHGKEDTRVHTTQSLELYRHLKTLGQSPVRLVLYPGEGHGNRKAGARYDYNLRTMQWFEHYLKGPGGEPPPYELVYPLEDDGKKDEKKNDDDKTKEKKDEPAPTSG